MLFRDAAPLDDSAEAAASALGNVDAETLVKDYWVTESLRILSKHFGDHFVFKGPTSLTKAVACVDRFSEDVDILITSKPEGQSFTGLMKSMVKKIVDSTPLDDERLRSTTNISRDVRFTYPTRHGRLYKPEIILEMGVRGTDMPGHLTYEIEPLLATTPIESFDAAGYSDLASFDVAVMHPARTLWEKIVLLHTDVVTDAWRSKDATRFARHYGDIGALLGVADVVNAIADPENRAVMDAQVRDVSATHFGEVPPVPDGGYARSPAFNPTGEFGAYLDKRFESAVASLWSSESLPVLADVLGAVHASEALLDPS
jgi:hypothetical protein